MRKSSVRASYLLAVSDHCYRALLLIYPRAFRHTFGLHMTQVFRDWCRQTQRERGTAGLLSLWIPTGGDLVVTAFQERLAQWSQMRHLPRSAIVHIGGTAALLGGTLYLLSTFFSPTGLAGTAVPGSITCFVLGVVGLHALMWEREGRVGGIGFVLVSAGLALGLISMTGSALGVVGSNPAAQHITIGEHAGLILLGVGMLLWGMMAFRLKVLGHWSALPLVIGLFSLTGIGFFLPTSLLALETRVDGPYLLQTLPVMFAACWMLLGYALLRSQVDGASVLFTQSKGKLSSGGLSSLFSQEGELHMHNAIKGGWQERMPAIAALVLTPLIWPLGVALIWSSSAWNRRDKLIGTLLPPGGYLPVWWMTTQVRTACNVPLNAAIQMDGNPPCPIAPLHYGPPEVVHVVGGVLLIVLIVLPILTTTYMTYRLSRRERLGKTVAAEGVQ